MSFQEQGYQVVPDFVSADQCAALKAQIRALTQDVENDQRSVFTTGPERSSDAYFLTSGDKIRFFWEPGERALNKVGHALHALDPVFANFSTGEDVARVAAALGYREPRVLQSMYIFKRPYVGGEVSAHIDHSFLWTEPMSVCGLWFALDDASLENGCLQVLPGGHRIPVKERFLRSGEGTRFEVFDETPYPEKGWRPLEVPAGTLVVLHGALPHKSGPNESGRPREAYTLHLIEADARYPAENWLQPPALRGFLGFSSSPKPHMKDL